MSEVHLYMRPSLRSREPETSVFALDHETVHVDSTHPTRDVTVVSTHFTREAWPVHAVTIQSACNQHVVST